MAITCSSPTMYIIPLTPIGLQQLRAPYQANDQLLLCFNVIVCKDVS